MNDALWVGFSQKGDILYVPSIMLISLRKIFMPSVSLV